mmetsp:Transcript_73866/g.159855  ORF Transcript_73866/g.159855 Transcript_73866/m.159855 type:complete len:85 (+) Transcript_73866:165-419(+)
MRSRWLVGSSRSNMCGDLNVASAKATRTFSPPLKVLREFTAWCRIPKEPSCARASCSVASGRHPSRISTGVESNGSSSATSCEK